MPRPAASPLLGAGPARCRSVTPRRLARRPETSQIGRPKLAEITGCVAAEYLGEFSLPCPMANEVPTLWPGCWRCVMVQSADLLYAQHLERGEAWMSLGSFAATRMQPNAFLRKRRMAIACEALGI